MYSVLIKSFALFFFKESFASTIDHTGFLLFLICCGFYGQLAALNRVLKKVDKQLEKLLIDAWQDGCDAIFPEH